MSTTTLTTGQVITLGDGRLACPLVEVYQALAQLLDDQFMTHQLPGAGRFVEPYIVEACPWVTDLPPLDMEDLDDDQKEDAVYAWVDRIAAQHGQSHVIPDPSGQWIHFDPLEEAATVFMEPDEEAHQ